MLNIFFNTVLMVIIDFKKVIIDKVNCNLIAVERFEEANDPGSYVVRGEKLLLGPPKISGLRDFRVGCIAGRVARNSRKLGVLTPSREDWF